jgi:hypothetical protein
VRCLRSSVRDPGVLGALFRDNGYRSSYSTGISEECDVAAYSRLYHVAPFLVIGIGCLISARTIFKQDDE